MGIAVVEKPMTGTHVDDRWAYLLRAWREIDMPEGWRAEIREEGIVLVPPPSGAHGTTAFVIQRQIDRKIPDGWEIHQGTGVAIAPLVKLRAPDLLVVPSEAVPQERGVPVPSDEVLLAVEIVSRDNAHDDRVVKREEYARGQIPLYLLVDGYDPRGASVTLFATPKGGDYADSHRVDWGEPVMLPEPFGFKLETTGFRVPRD